MVKGAIPQKHTTIFYAMPYAIGIGLNQTWQNMASHSDQGCLHCLLTDDSIEI